MIRNVILSTGNNLDSESDGLFSFGPCFDFPSRKELVNETLHELPSVLIILICDYTGNQIKGSKDGIVVGLYCWQNVKEIIMNPGFEMTCLSSRCTTCHYQFSFSKTDIPISVYWTIALRTRGERFTLANGSADITNSRNPTLLSGTLFPLLDRINTFTMELDIKSSFSIAYTFDASLFFTDS